MRARSRLIRLVLLALVMATAVPLRAQEGRAVQQAAGAERLLARSRVVVGGTIFESKTIALQPDDLDVADAEMPRPPVQVRLSIVNFDEAVFGPASGTTSDPAVKRQLLTALLARKVSDVERLRELTAVQRKKLELAGRGDLYRLFEQIEDLRSRCQAVGQQDQEQNAMTLLLEWGKSVSREIQPLKAALAAGPFGERSLFAKTLTGMISPAELAEYRRQQSSAASQPAQPLNEGVRLPVPLGIADRNARLAEVLAEWEKAASRIDRLDCQFNRFKYDRTFGVEWRSAGALAIEKSGSAVYRITPDPIKPGEMSKKLAAGGAPYTLKSGEPERWHWTGKSVIWVNEKTRTFEEFVLPGNVRRGEFEPDPPPLPQEAAEGAGPRRAKGSPTPQREKSPRQTEGPAVGELVTGAILGFAVTVMISNAELSGFDWVEAISQFPLPRPFLLRMQVGDLKDRFQIELKSETDTEIWLAFTPKNKKDQANLTNAILILSKDRYQPKALKMIDPTGSESVHVFKNVQINRRGPVDDLERPDLHGYRRLRNEAAR